MDSQGVTSFTLTSTPKGVSEPHRTSFVRTRAIASLIVLPQPLDLKPQLAAISNLAKVWTTFIHTMIPIADRRGPCTHSYHLCKGLYFTVKTQRGSRDLNPLVYCPSSTSGLSMSATYGETPQRFVYLTARIKCIYSRFTLISCQDTPSLVAALMDAQCYGDPAWRRLMENGFAESLFRNFVEYPRLPYPQVRILYPVCIHDKVMLHSSFHVRCGRRSLCRWQF